MPRRPSVLDPTTRLLKDRIRELFRKLPSALAGDEEAVHDMRVGGRRLRAALPLLARDPRGKRVRRARAVLRQLVRTAGRSRDLDVSVRLIEERLTGDGSAQSRLLRRRLRQARGRSRGRMAEALLDLEIAQLRRDLRAVVHRRAEPVFTVTLRIREARDERGGELLQRLASLGARFDAVVLHDLRRRLRRLRYVAEVSERLRGQDSEAPALFKQLQDRLGHVHDLYVAAQWLFQQAASAQRRGQDAPMAQARALAEGLLADSRAEHARFLSEQPDETIRRALEAMSPVRIVA